MYKVLFNSYPKTKSIEALQLVTTNNSWKWN